MASYYEYFEIKVEGTDESVKSICEAVSNYAPNCEMACSEGKIIVENMCKIRDEDDACEFAQMLARASKGASFRAEGDTECSVSGEMMKFLVELVDGKLTLRHSTWYYEYCSMLLDDYETYEEYCEDEEEEIENEEDFLIVKENEFSFLIDGEFLTEVPFIDEFQLEY